MIDDPDEIFDKIEDITDMISEEVLEIADKIEKDIEDDG